MCYFYIMKIFVRGLILFAIAAVFAFYGFSIRAKRNAAGPNSQINFIENSWTEALKQASVNHKYIFVDAYATWCGPCKMLKSTTFKNNKAAAFFNNNFVNVAIDMEKGQGPKLASQWQVQAYPTLFIFDSAGKPVLYAVGYIGADDLIRFGQAALKKK